MHGTAENAENTEENDKPEVFPCDLCDLGGESGPERNFDDQTGALPLFALDGQRAA